MIMIDRFDLLERRTLSINVGRYSRVILYKLRTEINFYLNILLQIGEICNIAVHITRRFYRKRYPVKEKGIFQNIDHKNL